MTGFAPPASRNAPCPCGSGRRYKECHGRPADVPVPSAPVVDALGARMQAALAAQQAGRHEEAIAAYGEVLERAPDTFDAWHMRGASHLQLQRFDQAEADIRRALALNPQLPGAERNLALVHGGRAMTLAVARLSRAALPRFAPLVVDPPVDPLDGVDAGTRCHVLALGAPAALVERVAERAAARGATVRRVAPGGDARLAAADEAALRASGRDDVLVAVGCAFALDDWTIEASPRATALVVDGDDVGAVEDRLRELSGQRRRRVRLAVAPGATIDLAALPHARLAP
jgi:hypothetical protein